MDAAVSAATQRKGRALFHPLRLALTARETGPEMAKLLPLIGRARRPRASAGSGHKDRSHAQRHEQERCDHAHDPERQTLGDGVAEQHDGRVGEQHAERGAEQ